MIQTANSRVQKPFEQFPTNCQISDTLVIHLVLLESDQNMLPFLTNSRLTSSSILLCFDLGLQVFWVHVLVVVILLWWFALSTAETTAATAAATGENGTAHDRSLRKRQTSDHGSLSQKGTCWKLNATATGKLARCYHQLLSPSRHWSVTIMLESSRSFSIASKLKHKGIDWQKNKAHQQLFIAKKETKN